MKNKKNIINLNAPIKNCHNVDNMTSTQFGKMVKLEKQIKNIGYLIFIATAALVSMIIFLINEFL